MATMLSTDQTACYQDVMTRMSQDNLPCGIVKADLLASVQAVDTWVSNNAASFNTALPTAARNNLTVQEKALLLMYVLSKRYGVGVF